MTGFWRSERGATAAEFALTLPILLLFIFGIIDGGRYLWEVNRLEKAMQAGARFAVVTDPVASGLRDFSFVSLSDGGTGFLTQGDRIPIGAFGTVTCNDTSCTCVSTPANMTCTRDTTVGADGLTTFGRMITRMQAMSPRVAASNVEVEYRSAGLGFAGDPNGMDVAPLVTVRVRADKRPTFTFLTSLMLASTLLPAVESTLTIEDGRGTVSN